MLVRLAATHFDYVCVRVPILTAFPFPDRIVSQHYKAAFHQVQEGALESRHHPGQSLMPTGRDDSRIGAGAGCRDIEVSRHPEIRPALEHDVLYPVAVSLHDFNYDGI